MPRMERTEDEAKSYFRNQVLTAFDKSFDRITGIEFGGWKDEDLPELFKAVDAQVNRIMKRNNFEYRT